MSEPIQTEFVCRWPVDMPAPHDADAVREWLDAQAQLDPLGQSEFIQARVQLLEWLDNEMYCTQKRLEWAEYEFEENYDGKPGVTRLYIRDDEANYGTSHFDEAVDLCHKAGIAYMCWDEGKYEWGGSEHTWKPGMDEVFTRPLSGDSVVLGDTSIERLIDQSADLDDLRSRVKAYFEGINIFEEEA